MLNCTFEFAESAGSRSNRNMFPAYSTCQHASKLTNQSSRDPLVPTNFFKQSKYNQSNFLQVALAYGGSI